MDHTRTCHHCHRPLPCVARSDARYCSTRCRVAAHRVRHAGSSPIPSSLRYRDRWVRHYAKRPVTVQGRGASCTNARTWATFASASASTVGDGLGFVLNGDGIVCLDLDHCITDDGVEPWAATVLANVPATYVEVSPSGRGLHVWGLGDVPAGRVLAVDGGKVEVYGSGRYLTVTEKPYAGAPSLLADLTATIARVTHH